MPAPFSLHRPSEDDWAAIRDLRIRAVTDTPIAFLESREQALVVDEDGWRARARRNVGENSTQVVAVSSDGLWVGSMICFISDGAPSYVADARLGPPRANLVGVFVDPDWRGDVGVTDTLLGEVMRWVRDEKGLDRLHLHVSEENPRARRSYEKRGFVATGVVDLVPGRLDRELEMVIQLRP
ncbi:MAG: GNAT family N-acetyltransferase [Pseudolysinimonas sp.]